MRLEIQIHINLNDDEYAPEVYLYWLTAKCPMLTQRYIFVDFWRNRIEKGETLIMHACQCPIITETVEIDLFENFKDFK